MELLGQKQLQSEVVFFIIIMQKGPFISKACSSYIRFQNYPQLLVYQSLSGLGSNRIGRYYECLADDNNQYFLIEAHHNNDYQTSINAGNSFLSSYLDQDNQKLGKFLQNNFTTGFCFNKACSSQDLNYGLLSASEYVKLPFQIDRVTSPADVLPSYDVWTFCVLSLIGFLLFSCLVSTILKIYFKKIKYKKEHLLIQCFSLQNTIRLLSYKRNNLYDEIRVFSGVKFISFMGIVFSHMLILLLRAPSTQFKKNPQIQIFYPLFYSIDVWLSISGFFLSYIALKQYQEYQSVKIHLLRIARRFLRFWPLYIVIVMFTWKIAPFIGNGPLWGYAVKYFQNQCGALIINYFLLVQNFSSNSCNSWLWLWQIDIQLCVFFTPLLLLYCCLKARVWKFVFFTVQILLLVGSMIIPSLFQQAQNIHEFFGQIEFESINISPITRVGAYMVGYNLGIVFYQFRRNSIQENKIYIFMARRMARVIVVMGSFLILGVMAYYISNVSVEELSFLDKVWFNSFHFLFPLTVCVLISPPLFGFSSWFKTFLEFSKFGLLSKMSLSAYGVHFIIQVATIYSRKTDLYLNNLQIALSAVYSFLPIFVISIFFTALLQMPIYMAKKIYLKTPRITYFEH